MKVRARLINFQNRNSINITPLIDVIFLLMVFFIMTINFNKSGGVLENQLPQVSSTESSDSSKDYETVRLKIKMVKEDTELKIYLQERVVFNYEDLLLYLNKLPNDILIVFEPSNNVPYKHVIGVYNMCLKSKKERIVFSL
ncbi:MAG: biopolymer transporter ExbD [Proteobacteria bacterium]|nr:biopolymer transporter ExbD [Desulfobacteraceae bacterium]MBU4001463.1 biopolymer transporter ExbD [Pseudomonadota bacterium]MBU4318561.1 biopolymer transporter ExbD [Pseudomonadota bacterium]MBU4470388.1 biopolymer transporter ExbD [Pseudomonadota bacterium]